MVWNVWNQVDRRIILFPLVAASLEMVLMELMGFSEENPGLSFEQFESDW